MVTKYTLKNSLTMVAFCFCFVAPCKTQKGLDNHLKSRPGCLNELGISRASNWAAILRLSSVTTSSKAINQQKLVQTRKLSHSKVTAAHKK
jgi:Zn-finger protein